MMITSDNEDETRDDGRAITRTQNESVTFDPMREVSENFYVVENFFFFLMINQVLVDELVVVVVVVALRW